MLQIILTVIKFVGICLGILLGILLVLLLLVLFVPVRYKLDGEKGESVLAEGKASWLFHILTFRVSYEKEEMKQVLRIFGVPVWKR